MPGFFPQARVNDAVLPDEIPRFSQTGAGAGEINTISAQGGGLALTASITKLLLDLRVRSVAATSPLNVAEAADLITFTIDALVNADIDGAAAIAYSKLNLTGLVVNADIAAAAAIAQSKLNLAITNSELVSGVFGNITGLGTQTQELNQGNQNIINIAMVNIGLVVEDEIASGEVPRDQTHMKLDTEGSTTTTDQLDGITGAVDGDLVFIRTTAFNHDVTVIDVGAGTDTFQINGDFTLSAVVDVICLYARVDAGSSASPWSEFSRSDNA